MGTAASGEPVGHITMNSNKPTSPRFDLSIPWRSIKCGFCAQQKSTIADFAADFGPRREVGQASEVNVAQRCKSH
jgi:hypothetical protein